MDFDPDAFAAIATGDDVDAGAGADVQEASGAANHAAVEGGPDERDVGSESTLREMFLSSEPHTPLEKVDDPWDPERGGTTRIYRGLQKMFDFDGMPAVVDLSIGAFEAMHAAKDAVSADADQEESDDADSSRTSSTSGDVGDEAPDPPEGVGVA